MKEERLISIIMSEYNTPEELLKASIKSLLAQTYKNFEIVLIDDCGKNDVKKIADSFEDDRIKVYKNEKNMGLVKSLNRALELANGEYVVRMDTDDWCYPDRIEKQVKFVIENPEYAVVSGGAHFFDGKEIFGETSFSGEVTREIALNGGTPIVHPAVIAKKEAILKVGGYPDYKRCEDYALWLELLLNDYKLYVMDEILIKYHLSETDYSKRTLKTRKDFFRLLKEKYTKLKPSKIKYICVIIKTFIAGIMPHKIMAKYHRKKFKKD